jgi:putative DNA primase/helicase
VRLGKKTQPKSKRTTRQRSKGNRTRTQKPPTDLQVFPAVQEAPQEEVVVVSSDSIALPPIAERIYRARTYVQKMKLARAHHGGHNATYRVAAFLRNDCALETEDAFPIMREYNERLKAGGEETWTEKDMRHKLVTVQRNKRYGRMASPAPFDNPDRLAAEFLDDEWVYWNAQMYRYVGRKYVLVPDHELEAEVWGHVNEKFNADYNRRARKYETQQAQKKGAEDPPVQPSGGTLVVDLLTLLAGAKQTKTKRSERPALKPVTRSTVSNTIGAIKSKTLIASTIPMPSMLPNGEERPLIALENGLLDIGSRMLSDHTPDWFSTVCLPYGFVESQLTPKWNAFLARNLEGDPERIALLQEWFGYCLTYDTTLHKALILIGDGRNGKSVLLTVLGAMLGRENVSHVGLVGFNERFTLVSTLGKLANISADMGEIDKIAEGNLKEFIGGDKMKFEHKNKEPFFAKPTARAVFATNNLPRFSDKTDGVWERLIVFPMTVRIAEADRVPGMNTEAYWKEELPGIMNWALEGLARLRANRRFTEVKICETAVASYRQDCNPAGVFLKESCEIKDGKQVPCKEIYGDYKEWCSDHGYLRLAAGNFGREVARAFPAVVRRQIGSKKNRVWIYEGLEYFGIGARGPISFPETLETPVRHQQDARTGVLAA